MPKKPGLIIDMSTEYVDSYITEATEDTPKKYYIRGEFGRINMPNRNKRIYTEKIMTEAINETLSTIGNRNMLGQINHPATPNIDYENSTHIVTKLEIQEDGRVYGEAEVLDPERFPKANILIGLIESKVKFGISSRGYGKVLRKPGGLLEVAPGYKLLTYDIVNNPSSWEAFPEPVYEDVELEEEEITVKNIFEEIFN